MSAEDIRENYKQSRQSNDVKLKLNGATYRKVRNEFSHTKMGNIIKVKDHGQMNDLEDLNKKYSINKSNVTYSLNKQKRWQIASELTKNMSEFEAENVDVRLYETRNRNEKKSNCIAIHKSKGDQIHVKKTYANLESIKKKQEIDDNDPNDIEYVQYEIQYAPKKDILKYGTKKFSEKNSIAQSTKKNFYSKYEDYSSDISDLSEDEYLENNRESNDKKTIELGVEDLINAQLCSIVEKNEQKNRIKGIKE